MNDKDDLSVWSDFIKKEFRVENKDVGFSNTELNNDNRSKIFKNKKKLPLPGLLTKKTVKKLATKKIKTNATLDLHGLNIEKARATFISFLDTCWKHKYSYVLIITGKGRGIIKSAFIGW